jgi:hypothetical protein
MIEISQATIEDCKRFYGDAPIISMRGYVAKDGDRVLGIAGTYISDGSIVAFSEITDELKRHKRAIVRAMKLLVPMFDAIRAPLYAVAKGEDPVSQYFLIRLGFKPTGYIGQFGEVMRREPCR